MTLFHKNCKQCGPAQGDAEFCDGDDLGNSWHTLAKGQILPKYTECVPLGQEKQPGCWGLTAAISVTYGDGGSNDFYFLL